METITIPYEDYKKLLEESSMYRDINRELRYILREKSNWNNYREYMEIEENIDIIFKKYLPNEYKAKCEELMPKDEEVKE